MNLQQQALQTDYDLNRLRKSFALDKEEYRCLLYTSDSIQRKTLKFAQLPNRYLYFSNNSLIVYFSIGPLSGTRNTAPG